MTLTEKADDAWTTLQGIGRDISNVRAFEKEEIKSLDDLRDKCMELVKSINEVLK